MVYFLDKMCNIIKSHREIMQKLSCYHHEDATGERKYSYGKLSVKAKHQQKVNIGY
jgi:hypothetical protein